MLVRGLEPNSPTAEGGIYPADVIRYFNHQIVKSVAQLSILVQQELYGKPVAVLVQRERSQLFLPILIPEKRVG